jgi:hypothetical protein
VRWAIEKYPMAGFVEKINLKEKAEEDLYFAKLDKKLIQALHDKQREKDPSAEKQAKDIRLQGDKH